MKISKTTTTIGLCILGCLSVHAQTTFNATIDSNLLDAANWDNGLPGVGNDGTITVDGSYTGLNNGDDFTNGGTVTVDAGVTLTLANDTAINGGTLIVNGTLNVSDDIFPQDGTLILNPGSVTTTGDDWEANANASVITINGGTHTAGDFFGTQGFSATLNILGGNITANRSRFSGNSFVTLGGNATLNVTTTHFTSTTPGGFDILSSWTGSFTVGSLTGAGSTWENVLIAEYTFDGNPIDATVFANNFEVSNGGQTLSLIPEPRAAFLVGLSGLVLLFRRRR